MIDGEPTKAELALLVVLDWLDDFYGPFEDYGDGQHGMVQLDHGHEEYEARMMVAKTVRDWFDEASAVSSAVKPEE